MKTLFSIAAVAVALAAQPAAAKIVSNPLTADSLTDNGAAWNRSQVNMPANEAASSLVGTTQVIAAYDAFFSISSGGDRPSESAATSGQNGSSGKSHGAGGHNGGKGTG